MNRILLGASVSLSVALLALWWYLGIQLEVKASLEAEVRDKEGIIEEQAVILNSYERSREITTEVLLANQEDKERKDKENTQLKREIRILREQSKDQCLDAPVDAAIINRLQRITSETGSSAHNSP